MNVVEAFKKATAENKMIKRVSWETWLDPKKVYISWADVLAEDWHLKTDDSIYYVGLNKDGVPVKTVVGVPDDPSLKWILLSKLNEVMQGKK